MNRYIFRYTSGGFQYEHNRKPLKIAFLWQQTRNPSDSAMRVFGEIRKPFFHAKTAEYQRFQGIQRDDTHGRCHDRHAQTADKRQGSYRLRDIRTTPNRVFNGPSLRETPPTNQTTETVKSRIISLEILLHAQRQTIMRQGRSTKTAPVYISVFIHQRHAVTGQMLFDPFR